MEVCTERSSQTWIFTHRDYSCQLQRVHEDHICNFTVDVGFRSFDKYTMTLRYLQNGTWNSSLLDASFKPAKNSEYLYVIKEKSDLHSLYFTYMKLLSFHS